MVEITKEKYNEDMPCCGTEEEDSHYPWGTSITLRDELIEALGLSECKAGEEVMIKAKAFVISKRVSTEASVGSEEEKDATIEIQLTSIEIGKESPDVVNTLYGE